VFDFVVDSFLPVAIASSALLFFYRVRAIYEASKKTTIFFFLLWLTVLGSNMTIAIGVVGGTVGPTKYCDNESIPIYVVVSFIFPLIYDTLVFFAISIRLTRNVYIDDMTVGKGFKVAILGKYLPTFSRSLLKDGQSYYL